MCNFDEMTPEERGKLFPVKLCEHDPGWSRCYQKEKALLATILEPGQLAAVHHIGSTAVPGLLAKPSVDILLEIRPGTDPEALANRAETVGYLVSRPKDYPPPSMMLMKGYTPQGFQGQAVHVHVRYAGDHDEIHFRNYLLTHPDTAAEYAALKGELQALYPYDRDAYTAAKTAFVQRVTRLARERVSQA